MIAKKTAIFSVSLAIIAVFFLFHNALASDGLIQLEHGYSYDNGGNIMDDEAESQKWLTPPQATGTPITSVSLFLEAYNHCSDWQLKLRNTALATYNSISLDIPENNANWYKFQFASNSNFRTDNLSLIYLDSAAGGCSTGQHIGKIYGSDTTSTYSTAYLDDGTKLVKNAAFIINNNDNNVYFDFYPRPTSTFDFVNWGLQMYVNDPIDNHEQDSLVILWTNSTTAATQIDYCLGCGWDGLNQFYTVPKLTPFWASGNSFTAQAFYVNTTTPAGFFASSTPLLAVSPLWNFNINNNTTMRRVYKQGDLIDNELNPLFYSPWVNPSVAAPTTGTTTVDFVRCDYDWPINRVCEALVWLFLPSDRVLNDFRVLKDELAYKPPFGYISVYKAEFETLSMGTSSINNAWLAQWPIFSYIRSGLIIIFGFFFGWYVFVRFKNFSLHG